MTVEGIQVFLEGQIRQTSDWDDFIEVRMDGPYWREETKNTFTLRVEVNILTQVAILPEKNLYTAPTIDGIVAEYLTTIPVYKLGDEAGDDGTQIGCLDLVRNPASRDWSKRNEFGQVETKTPLRQTTTEAHYEIELKGA
jgi:hypothetical protein